MKGITINIENLEEVKAKLEGILREIKICNENKGIILSEESLRIIAKGIMEGVKNEKENNTSNFTRKDYIQGLISKIKKNTDMGDIDIFASREPINVILFDDSDEFVCKMDTINEHEINFEDKEITIKIKGTLEYSKLINKLLRDREFSGKAILETMIRNTNIEDYLVKMFTSKIDLLQYKTIKPSGNDVSGYEIMFVIPYDAEIDYEVTKI